MRKLAVRILLCFTAAAAVFTGSLFLDRAALDRELIRLHVVAASDSEEDQAIKLRVRDAVLESIGEAMSSVSDAEQAKAYLRENLPRIQQAASQTLAALGCSDTVLVTLCREVFDTRFYDTFTLPAGVYEALRITIGEGEGHNWWCVAFPTLCLPAASVDAVAADAGLSAPLRGAITGEKPYALRFYLLDLLGRARGAMEG